MRKSTFILPIIVLVLAGILSSVFIVDEREKVLVLQFGKVVAVKDSPGLAFKIPLIQEVARYDDRILSRDVPQMQITPSDDRRLEVDAFARYRIADVKMFRLATAAEGENALNIAGTRLDSILRSETREALGSVASNDILSADRAALMLRIRNGAISQARSLGLEIIDVRLKRTDLPKANQQATFDRMRAEREREAADEIARGNEAAQRFARRQIGHKWRSYRMPNGNRRSPEVKRMPSGTQSSLKPLAQTPSSLPFIARSMPIAVR